LALWKPRDHGLVNHALQRLLMHGEADTGKAGSPQYADAKERLEARELPAQTRAGARPPGANPGAAPDVFTTTSPQPSPPREGTSVQSGNRRCG
jgi:hypothetical protein